ncbi:hypothetical protein ACP4OV_022395 [Aristida adscensionis]
MQTRGATAKKTAMGSSSTAGKKARTPRRAASKQVDEVPQEQEEEEEEEQQQQEEQETTMNFSMELDALECQVCFMPFEAEVYMCKNGHGACGSCCIRIGRKCGSCGEPTGDLRNRHLEAVLAAMVTTCKFKRYGCGESVRYTDKRRHEEACPRAPFHCPFAGCAYHGDELCGHVEAEHDAVKSLWPYGAIVMFVTLRKSTPFVVRVHRRLERVFVLLNGGDVLAGRSLSLLCLGPEEVGMKYRMEVSGGGEPGAPLLSATGTVPFARRAEGFKPKGFLFVPDAYWDDSGTVSVTFHVL